MCLLKCPGTLRLLCETKERYHHYLTFNSEFKADMAERHGPCVCLQLADTADVVIIQVNVHKLLLFIHSAYRSEGRRVICETKTRGFLF